MAFSSDYSSKMAAPANNDLLSHPDQYFARLKKLAWLFVITLIVLLVTLICYFLCQPFFESATPTPPASSTPPPTRSVYRL